MLQLLVLIRINCNHFLFGCFCGNFCTCRSMWKCDELIGFAMILGLLLLTTKTLDLVANPIYLFIYFSQFSVVRQIQSLDANRPLRSRDTTMRNKLLCGRGCSKWTLSHFYIFMTHAPRDHVAISNPVACLPSHFVRANYTTMAIPAEARGPLTRKHRDIIWFHFHLNSFPLADLILLSQYEPWPWISTGLQMVFNVHQSLMWVSPPHSGVLLTGPSPCGPTLGPSGPSRVPNRTSVSTVAKLLQSDWLGNALMKKKKKYQTTLAQALCPIPALKHGVHPVSSHARAVI